MMTDEEAERLTFIDFIANRVGKARRYTIIMGYRDYSIYVLWEEYRFIRDSLQQIITTKNCAIPYTGQESPQELDEWPIIPPNPSIRLLDPGRNFEKCIINYARRLLSMMGMRRLWVRLRRRADDF